SFAACCGSRGETTRQGATRQAVLPARARGQIDSTSRASSARRRNGKTRGLVPPATSRSPLPLSPRSEHQVLAAWGEGTGEGMLRNEPGRPRVHHGDLVTPLVR